MAVPFDNLVICPVLIGRTDQVASLDQMIAGARGGQETRRVACIAGEAGIGKSRLIAAAKARAAHSGYAIVQGNCFEPDSVLPYAPLLDLLHTFCATHSAQDVARAMGPNCPELARLLPELGTFLPGTAPMPALE